jgi:hypothetical protein
VVSCRFSKSLSRARLSLFRHAAGSILVVKVRRARQSCSLAITIGIVKSEYESLTGRRDMPLARMCLRRNYGA